jgi:hypothetical protein
MSMAQTELDLTPSGDPHCPNCKAGLPPRASFCASCGERILRKNAAPLYMNESDISTRYRITSLVRRRPHVNLFFAIDNLLQRPVGLREIIISELSDEARQTACEAVQLEYDLLRREHIPSIIPVIDLRHYQGHLYDIAGWPTPGGARAASVQLQTLQDVLQSGIGLPEIDVSLAWIEQLCLTVDRLHQHSIVPGDLDPQALVLNGSDYTSDIALMVSWLPETIRRLRPVASAISNTTNYSAPEVLLGKPEPISDVYSLGAILYLLLTGVPPDGPTARLQRRLRSPAELNPRISSGLDEFVIQAIALEGSERFTSVLEMAEGVYRLRSRTPRPGNRGDAKNRSAQLLQTPLPVQMGDEIGNADRLFTPLPETDPTDEQGELAPLQVQEEDAPGGEEDFLSAPPGPPQLAEAPGENDAGANQKPSLAESFKKRITGMLPALPRSQAPRTPGRGLASTTAAALVPAVTAETGRQAKEISFLKQLQQLIHGEQQHATAAAAIIETPLRVQPNQSYIIRIQIMGRDRVGKQAVESRQDSASSGLSTLVEGELVYIEVRSVLYQSYAYIVQQAAVTIPAVGYAAEVTIPMQPLASGPSGRRDRLHIFFMDELRRPLYEKPFIIEIFVSPLVQPGREGHNVLPIPL